MKFEDDNLEYMCARKTVDCDDGILESHPSNPNTSQEADISREGYQSDLKHK